VNTAEVDQYFTGLRRGFERGMVETEAELAKLTGTESRFKVLSAEEMFTAEEIAGEEARCAAVLAQDAARERITNLHGEKAARAFDAFRVLDASEFASASDCEPAWQVRGVIPSAGTGLHPGPSGTLKSFAELELAACIHRGVPFHGREVRKGRAVIVCAEGARGYKRRLRAYAKHHNVPLSDLPAVIPAAPNLFEPTQITALIEQLKLSGGATYVCLDTKWRCSPGADENSANDQLIVLGSMDRIARELGCFCMAVTHTGRDASKGARGSSSQYAAVDVELTQERTGEHCTLRVSKMKDSDDGAAYMFKAVRVDLGRNAHDEPESSLVLEPAEPDPAVTVRAKGPNERAIIDYVKASGETRFAKEALIDDVQESLKGKGTNVRRDNLKRALEKLTGSFFEESDGELTVRPGIVHDNAGWLDNE